MFVVYDHTGSSRIRVRKKPNLSQFPSSLNTAPKYKCSISSISQGIPKMIRSLYFLFCLLTFKTSHVYSEYSLHGNCCFMSTFASQLLCLSCILIVTVSAVVPDIYRFRYSLLNTDHKINFIFK